jgi:hypothetical protein
MHAQIISCRKLSETHSALCPFETHCLTRTQPYAITYILHFTIWTLQVLMDGEYSTQPLEWIMHGQESNKCRLTTELQPGESQGFLRSCGKESGDQNLLLIESCPSDWTDHETAQKCSAYALYSHLQSNVSNKKICLQFTS